jgi:hypothetical protein
MAATAMPATERFGRLQLDVYGEVMDCLHQARRPRRHHVDHVDVEYSLAGATKGHP